ncbi:TniQ family protein [Saccharopolyspora shandongensis]|uniref:TniQ family protein n=1 Tax=Saccharopolyspora shandongensis TaxID=418495 RepID=UPI003445280E
MSRPRTLPIRVEPIPGEALDSWFAALAYRLHTPLGDLLADIGVLRRRDNLSGLPADVPTEWTVLLRPAEITALADATGVNPVAIEAMTLARYDGQTLSIDPATRQVRKWRLWGRHSGSRYCPDCLADTGGRWQLSWRLGWSFACIIHRRLLADTCPDCGRVPRRHLLAGLSAPGQCVQPAGPDARGRDAARCGSELTQAVTIRFPEDHPVLHAQRVLLDVIEEGKAKFGVYVTEPQPAFTVLSDLRALAARILRYADRDDLNTLPQDLLDAYDQALIQPAGYGRPARAEKRSGAMAPAHAAITAVGATAAVGILSSDTVRDAGTALRWLLRSSRQRGIVVSPTTLGSWGKGTSIRLKTVQLSALGPLLKPSDQLRYRINADTPCHRLPAGGAPSRHHRIPSLLWTEWALRLHTGGLYLHTLRAALSAILVLAGTRRSLPDTTRILGEAADPHDTSRVLQKLEADPHWPHILTALTRLADHLDDTDVPIDYHHRRRLTYDTLLPDDQWRHICRHTGTTPGQHRRLQLARCLLFEKISGLPADQAPASFAINTRETRANYLHFAARLPPELATHLNEAAQDFLEHQGIHDEPLEWQPSTHLLDDLTLPGHDPDLVNITALHHIVGDNRSSLSDAAQQLGTTLDITRYLLGKHPAPPPPLTETQAKATGHRRFEARSALPKERLIDLCFEQNLTLRDIAQRVGVSRGTITRLFDDYGIDRTEPRRPTKTTISRDWLYDQYVNHHRTLPDLAQETGMSTANMARWAKTHNIPLRPRGGASHNQVRLTRAQATTAPRILRPALGGEGAWERLTRFAAASRYRTITEAAKALGLNQPTLTTQINRLEHDLGGPLLERAQRARSLQLTPLGRRVVAAVARHTRSKGDGDAPGDPAGHISAREKKGPAPA